MGKKLLFEWKEKFLPKCFAQLCGMAQTTVVLLVLTAIIDCLQEGRWVGESWTLGTLSQISIRSVTGLRAPFSLLSWLSTRDSFLRGLRAGCCLAPWQADLWQLWLREASGLQAASAAANAAQLLKFFPTVVETILIFIAVRNTLAAANCY